MSSKTLDELNRRVRIAYEQMKRHEDEPSGRLYNLWRDKYNQANDELTKFIGSDEKEVTPVEVKEWLERIVAKDQNGLELSDFSGFPNVMNEDDFIQAGIDAREKRKKTAMESAQEWIDKHPEWVDSYSDFVSKKSSEE